MTFGRFLDEMSHHIIWKARFSKMIEGWSEEPIDAATAARDDLCELGKWIYGEGVKYGEISAYKELVKVHAEFHACAAQIVHKIQDGDKLGASHLMSGTLEAKSRAILSAVVDLRAEGDI